MAPSHNATLHALTERLASHSRSLQPLIGSNFASSLSPQAVAAAASAYRQPAPPPQLPNVPIYTRHQDPPPEAKDKETGTVIGDGVLRCPSKRIWPEPGVHGERKSAALSEGELDAFIDDMGIVMRREFDSWVEQCWTEAFHHIFTRTLPTLLIHLIMTGADPQFLRRQIVHGGPDLDRIFQTHMLGLLYRELELRLSGSRPSAEASSSKLPPPVNPINPAIPVAPIVPNIGVCFHNLLYIHDPEMDEDDHGLCLCHLTTCLSCFHKYAQSRKGAYSPLPYELTNSKVARGWSGAVETMAQSRARKESILSRQPQVAPIPSGRGFVKNPRTETVDMSSRQPPLFPHPQMTDVLAVEEHLRWRLKEMGAVDPAVESRYGPCTNAAAALEGIELPDEMSEDGDRSETGKVNGMANGGKNGKVVKMARGKGKVRRVVNGTTAKKDGKDKDKDREKGKACYLPKEWLDADPQARNMGIILTFRHFVKLLHQVTIASSPFLYPGYEKDVEELNRVHPIALYRRLAEPAIQKRPGGREYRLWQDCMDKWAEDIGAREKAEGNKHVNEARQAEAIEYYTRAISLDPKKTVYFSNRAVALNSLGYHERAEQDCKHILAKDGKNGKAFYQRALARRGLGRWREAEADLREVLRFQPGNESAKKLMSLVKGEVAKLPKQSVKDAMEF